MTDFKIEVLPPDDVNDTMMRLRIELQHLNQDEESGAPTALEWDFDPDHDNPMDLAKEMVKLHLPFEEFSEVGREIEKLVTAQKADTSGEQTGFSEEVIKDDKEITSSSVSSSPQHVSRPESGVDSQAESPDMKVDSTTEEQQPSSPKPEQSVENSTHTTTKPPPVSDVPSGEPLSVVMSTVYSADVSGVDTEPTFLTSEDTVEGTSKAVKLPMSEDIPPVISGGDKHRKSRQKAKVAKEGKRPMKLVLIGTKGDDIAECQFTNSGQQISFTFSLQADTPEMLAANLVGFLLIK